MLFTGAQTLRGQQNHGALLGLISQVDDCEFESELVPVVTKLCVGEPRGGTTTLGVRAAALGISKDYTMTFQGTPSSAGATTSGRLAELRAFVELGLPSTAELRRRNQADFYTGGEGGCARRAEVRAATRTARGARPSWTRRSCEDDRGAGCNLGILALFSQTVVWL